MGFYNAEVVSSRNLSVRHERSLRHGSVISSEVIEERGYSSVYKRSEISTEFGKNQRRAPGLLIPVCSPDGSTSYTRLRPDNPRPAYKKRGGVWIKKGVVKYEQPRGRGIMLDVHPRNRETIKNPAIPLYVTEGEKKADSLTSRGLCTIALFGVDCWGRGGELLPDWDYVALAGRTVNIVYDSDVMVKPEVQDALRRFVAALDARDAVVRVVYLPDAPDGSKQGVDDFLVAGGTVEDLESMARPFDATDLRRERMSRDEKLRRALVEIEAGYEAMPAMMVGQCTRRAVMRVALEQAAQSGKPVEDGIRFILDRRTWAERAGSTTRSVNRAVAWLEVEGYLRRDLDGRRSEEAGAIVLLTPRALPPHSGGSVVVGEEAPSRGSSHGEALVRPPLPELRWPFVLTHWEVDESGQKHPVYEYVARLGKRRGEVVRHLVESGGEASVAELMERFAGKNTRQRDFRRRVLADLAGYQRAYKGSPLSLGPAIIEIGDETVRLLPHWHEALELRRKMGGEIEAAERQKVTHLLQRAAFRERNQHKADRAPTEEEMERHRQGVVVDEIVSLLRARPDLQWGTVEDIREATFPNLRIQKSEVVEFLENHGLPVLWRAEVEDSRPSVVPGTEAPVLELVTPSRSEARARKDQLAEIRSRQAKHSEPTPDYVELMDRWRKNKEPVSGPETSDNWRTHPLDCECDACQCTEPRYVRIKGSDIPVSSPEVEA